MKPIVDDRGYNQIYRKSESWEIRNQRRVDSIIARLGINEESENQEILEIGCGTGEASYRIAKLTAARVYGADLCRPFIEQAKKNYNLPNLEYGTLDFNSRQDLEGIQRTQKFTGIIGNGILHHLYYSLEESLANMNRILVPGGKLVFWEPNFYNPYCLLIFNTKTFRKLAKLEPTEMTFTRGYIKKMLEATGFIQVSVEYRDFLLPGVPVWAIKPSILIGNFMERIPVLNVLAQSIFISAVKK